MTKIISRRIVSFLGVLSLMAPLAVSATVTEDRQAARTEKMEERQANREAKIEEVKDKRQDAFCSRFALQAANIGNKLTEQKARFDERKKNASGTLSEKRGDRDAKLEDKRSLADQGRSEMYAKLEARAKTDDERAAVADFKSTVEQAVTVRQAAVDAAITSFRTGVDTAVASRKSAMQNAVEEFDAAVKAAVAKAQSDCGSGVDPETVRSNFRSALEAARTSLKEDRSAAEKVGAQVKALAETRRIAVRKALDDFKATMEAARATLKEAFGTEAGV